MDKIGWKSYVLWIGLAEGVGALSAILSADAMAVYESAIVKPSFSPPGILFPIVWTILYALMGISAARISQALPSPERSRGLNLFIAQLIVNFFWSLIFFNAQAFGFAFFWLVLLWVLVLLMIKSFRKVDPVASALQIPYLLWLSFAGILNLAVWLLNR